jgi:hypothetical protein
MKSEGYRPGHNGFGHRPRDKEGARKLSEEVQALRNQAENLGMLENEIYFDFPKKDGSRVRLFGGPARALGTDSAPQILWVVINYWDSTGSGEDTRENVLSDSFLIGDRSVSNEAGIIVLDENGDFKEKAKKYPPIIWPTTDDGLGVFRGKQRVVKPVARPELLDSEQINKQIATTESLKDFLGDLKPGAEEERYPLA